MKSGNSKKKPPATFPLVASSFLSWAMAMKIKWGEMFWEYYHCILSPFHHGMYRGGGVGQWSASGMMIGGSKQLVDRLEFQYTAGKRVYYMHWSAYGVIRCFKTHMRNTGHIAGEKTTRFLNDETHSMAGVAVRVLGLIFMITINNDKGATKSGANQICELRREKIVQNSCWLRGKQ